MSLTKYILAFILAVAIILIVSNTILFQQSVYEDALHSKHAHNKSFQEKFSTLINDVFDDTTSLRRKRELLQKWLNALKGKIDEQTKTVDIKENESKNNKEKKAIRHDHVVGTQIPGLFPNTSKELYPFKIKTQSLVRPTLKSITTLHQKCVIPKLDPFHPDVLPYISYKWKERCGIKRKAKIINGKLHLKLKSVERAGFYYIRRISDNVNDFSEWHSLIDDAHIRLRKGRHSCLVTSERNQVLIGMLKNGEEYKDISDKHCNVTIVVVADNRPCTKDRYFYINKHNRIIHEKSGRCLIPRGDSIVLSVDERECSHDASKFKIKDGSALKHVSSNKYAHYLTSNGRILLQEGLQEDGIKTISARFHFTPDDANRYQDVDLVVPLTEEFIRVEIMQNGTRSTEHHMHVINPNDNKQSRESNKNKLNIIMLMIDSLSHANAQRQLNKTYEYLQNNPNSFILQGHSIVGDATTPQLCAMLTGHKEQELPEARRGFPNSKPVDDWPFIWKDFKEMGYTTVYSEDEPYVGTFQLRLHGFNNTPTTKYLRPYWWASVWDIVNANSKSNGCPHQYAFRYLKDLYNAYPTERKFVFFNFCNVGHHGPNKMRLADHDFIDFIEFLSAGKGLDDTVVFIFGDHGARTSEFRSSIQGKLEERLPLMTITVPVWFNKKFPTEMKHLRKNTALLTSHFDIYATLKHLQYFPNNNNSTNKYGKSLFTDLSSLNRSCEDAGIRSHWCPCLDYENVDISDTVAIKVAMKVVNYMNNLTNAVATAKKMCENLKLQNIIRASKRKPNKHVQRFAGTYRDGTCDVCGVRENRNVKLTTFIYEVVISVLPSHGKYEATAEYRTNNNETVLVNTVSRINLYGDQPKCIAKDYPHLRDYCYCKT